jgi:chromate transporter
MNQTANNQNPNLLDKLRELAQIFLKLGLIGFGGSQAHIAMMNEEAVVRRNWFTQEQFLEGIAICEMLPGPASTQMGIYTGYLYAGQIGALVAGLCFISPAFLIVVGLSWLYFRFWELPQVADLFLGIAPVITAIILSFCWKLGNKVLKKPLNIAIALAVFYLTLGFNVNILLQFIIAGLIGVFFNRSRSQKLHGLTLPFIPIYLGQISSEVLTLSSFWNLERIQAFFVPLTIFFLKVGSFIFGGGLVIIPLLEFEVVQNFHWLTREEFINGVAIGQISPGPVVLTAAFIGYKVAGFLGALTATIAIFTPSFIFIMAAAPLLTKVRENIVIKNFLKGVTPAVLGAIAAASIPIAQSAILQEEIILSLGGIAILVLSSIALIRYNFAIWKLIFLGGILGLCLGQISHLA